jgi:hypothetical protein
LAKKVGDLVDRTQQKDQLLNPSNMLNDLEQAQHLKFPLKENISPTYRKFYRRHAHEWAFSDAKALRKLMREPT